MLEEAGNLINLEVYTQNGIFVGCVSNLVVDPNNNKVDGIFIEETNPAVVDRSVSINIPFRWVQSVGDIIILRAFPDRVTFGSQEAGLSLPGKSDAKADKRRRRK